MKRSKFRVIKEVLGFFESVLTGCFFGCFRIKDDARRKTNPCANSISSEDRVSLVSKKELASDPLLQGQDAHLCLVENSDDCIIQRALDDEARVLKNCGALSKTPEEIQKTSNKISSESSEEDVLASNFISQLPGLYGKNDNLDEQTDPPCHTMAKLHCNLGVSENKFDGCILEEQQTVRKVLQFDGNKHVSWVDSQQDSVNLDISPSHNDSKAQTLDSSNSPYPTPLNLTDKMQTPGTVYPVNLDNLRTRKHTRIRTQYVYPVLKPVENLPQWIALSKDSCRHVESDDSFEQQLKSFRTDRAHKESNLINSRLPSPTRKRSQDGHIISTEESVCKKTPTDLARLSRSRDQVHIEPDTPELVISSLSQWLKPQPQMNEEGVFMYISNGQSYSEMNFDADRPIIGTVAAHWNYEPPCNSPRHWNGNGIPNSTNKYKEHQKVSWHATPFEERLEKVLSDEKVLPQRKLLYREPLEIEDERRESDTVAT